MSIAKRRFFSYAFSLVLLACAPRAEAHPVAQGAMEIRIEPGEITIRARVSAEEVFVASAFGAAAPAPGDSLAEVWRAHGVYLLNHLHLLSDDQPLAGRVVATAPPPDGAPSTARAVYDFAYPLPAGADLPQRIRLAEDVLKEFSYAPGNPWTASYVVRIEQPGRATPADGLLLDRNQPLDFRCATTPGTQRSATAEIPRGQLWREYIVHGLFHILTGYDHMLFMGALVLAAKTFWDVVRVVSVFTLAHTVTLTLSVLNVVRLPSSVVEPVIAASIVCVALQNVFAPASTRGWMRLAVAFGFGLFHGLGFAGGLLEAMSGLPPAAIAVALAAFSIGVELGHQVVVVPVFCALKLGESQPSPGRGDRFRGMAERYGSALISMAGSVYLVLALR